MFSTSSRVKKCTEAVGGIPFRGITVRMTMPISARAPKLTRWNTVFSSSSLNAYPPPYDLSDGCQLQTTIKSYELPEWSQAQFHMGTTILRLIWYRKLHSDVLWGVGNEKLGHHPRLLRARELRVYTQRREDVVTPSLTPNKSQEE